MEEDESLYLEKVALTEAARPWVAEYLEIPSTTPACLQSDDNPKGKDPKGKSTASTGQSEEQVVVVAPFQPPSATPDIAPGPSTTTTPDIPSYSAYPLTAHRLSQTLSSINNWMQAATSKLAKKLLENQRLILTALDSHGKELKELAKETKKLRKTRASRESVKELRVEVEKIKAADHLPLELLLHDPTPAVQPKQEQDLQRESKRRRVIPRTDDAVIELAEPQEGSSSQPQVPVQAQVPVQTQAIGIQSQDQYKNNSNIAAKRNLVLDRRFNRKNAANNVVRQALAAWGDSSSESGEDDEPGNSSMMAVESESTEYDSIFALTAQSDDEDDDDNEVNFLDVQKNLKSYSPKKLMSLANVLIDAYHSLINDIDVFTVELGEAEQSIDDLVIVVVDLRESIENLKKERNVLKKGLKM
ncbi:PREDICTED: uncharacterized protein DDB_G0290587-like [Nicotiana attenuata]|uniref:uncharacterized protein DDB_G0290587-like n=1 Tax=Nicotiana attenuata TaxID=49451 RepID=UPI0009047890|nr:PREDICTED: uncharacterized protein DDB_G0290587-like [Nicotiana attenuata]